MTTAIESLSQFHPKYLKLIFTCLLPVENTQEYSRNLANMMMNIVQPKLDAEDTSWDELDYYHYDYSYLMSSCAKAQASGALESRHVKKILDDCFNFPYVGYDLIQYCRETKILEEASGDDLLPLVRQAIINNPKAVEELKSGKEKAIGALVGAIMKQQKSSPVEIQKLIKAELGLT
jgi:Asp-tRNA(Asn)/Glu-tRNA(Gln) amidotransferase B subunit